MFSGVGCAAQVALAAMFWRSLRVQIAARSPFITALPLLFLQCSTGASATPLAAGTLHEITALPLDSRGLSVRSVAASLSEHIDTSKLLAPRETLSIQVVTCVMGFLGFFSSVLVLYWFCRMRKQFRHQLIMVLIVANVLRSVWYFIFTIVAASYHELPTAGDFCQAAGFFTQVGVELADFAVLFIAIHTALQVFRPRPLHLGKSGLYDYRYYVYGICTVIPILLSSLVFAKGRNAYSLQGPICMLPLRPFWWRLGLSWIPRYAIMLTIICLYVAIYFHAQFAMAVPKVERHSTAKSGHERPKWSNFTMLSPSRRQPPPQPSQQQQQQNRDSEKVARFDEEALAMHNDSGAHSVPCSPFGSPRAFARRASDGTTLVAGSSTRDGSVGENPFFPPMNLPVNSDPLPSAKQGEEPQRSSPKVPSSPVLRLPQPAPVRRLSSDIVDRHIETAEMQRRRSSIRKHLRLLFVYPIVYFAIWTIPFVVNVLNYSTYYASHPIYTLSLLSYIAVAGMGLIDSVIFALREQPWKHIPTADGTFWGSFKFWARVENTRLSVVSHSEFGTSEGSGSYRFPQDPGVRVSQLDPYGSGAAAGGGKKTSAAPDLDGTTGGRRGTRVGSRDFALLEANFPNAYAAPPAARDRSSRDWFDKL